MRGRVACVAALLLGCGGESAPTWHGEVGALVATRCGSCHVAGGIGVDFSDGARAAGWAAAMVAATEAGTMPPWSADDAEGCALPHPLVDDARLRDDELALLARWAEAGAPLGVGGPVAWPEAIEAIEADEVLVPTTPFPLGPGVDRVVCAEVGQAASQERWLRRAQVVPGDPAVTHHVVLMLDTQGLADPDGGWVDCFGGVGRSSPVLFWAPGTGPLELPDGAALRVPAGTSLLVQVHYFTGASEVAQAQPEVRVQWAEAAPALEAELRLVGNARDAEEGLLAAQDEGEARFLVPAGVVEHAERMRVPVGGPEGVDQTLWAVGHHMHRFGVSMSSAWWTRDQRRCLLSTPVWDYDWHRLYRYDVPLSAAPVLRSEDLIELRCVYSNHLGHEGTRQVLAAEGLQAPVDVGPGVGGLDEMCTALLGVVFERGE